MSGDSWQYNVSQRFQLEFCWHQSQCFRTSVLLSNLTFGSEISEEACSRCNCRTDSNEKILSLTCTCKYLIVRALVARPPTSHDQFRLLVLSYSIHSHDNIGKHAIIQRSLIQCFQNLPLDYPAPVFFGSPGRQPKRSKASLLHGPVSFPDSTTGICTGGTTCPLSVMSDSLRRKGCLNGTAFVFVISEVTL